MLAALFNLQNHRMSDFLFTSESVSKDIRQNCGRNFGCRSRRDPGAGQARPCCRRDPVSTGLVVMAGQITTGATSTTAS